MQITNVETIPYGSQQVLIKVHTDQGVVGLGDATPLLVFTGESQGSILTAIEKYLTPMILQENPLDIEKLSEKMNKLPWNMAAKSGIDMALYDIIGKALDIPVHSILGGRYHDSLLQAAAVGLTKGTPPDKVAQEAADHIHNGFQIIKVKIGKKYGLSLEDDFQRVQAVVDAIGSHAHFWVDCQAGYTSQEAVQIVRKIEQFNPLYIEQPTDRFDIKGMAEVRSKIDIPILADESVFSPLEALRVIQQRAADAIAIKFAKCGGIYAAKQIVSMADVAGLECMMISPGETNIGLAAYLHVAASAKNVRICNFGFKDQEDWITPLEVSESKYIFVPKDPGLGINVLKEIPKGPIHDSPDFVF